MALIIHYTRNDSGGFDTKRYYDSPMEFVTKTIPDGVPFEIYHETIGEDTRVTEDFEALKQSGTFHIIESAGGGAIGGALGFISKILNPILKLLMPSQKVSSPDLANQQADSPNNSLTNRNNKPRPYERSYDICGTVQSVPCDLMTVYRLYNEGGQVIEYGYYDVGRGYLDTPASGITDGDTLLANITGSSAAVYAPFTSPNNGQPPQTLVGNPIDQALFITASANEVDGQTLKAQNDLQVNVQGFRIQRLGSTGKVTDPAGNAGLDDVLRVGDIAFFDGVMAGVTGGDVNTTGNYPVLDITSGFILVDISNNQAQWDLLGSTEWPVGTDGNHRIGPQNTLEASFTDWVTISRIESERAVANISADNGMYKENNDGKFLTSVTAEMQYQAVDTTGAPFGNIMAVQKTVSGRSGDATGMTLVGVLPTATPFRARVRRVTDVNRAWEGQVVDEIKFSNLYGQAQDLTRDYGNRTTVHTARRQTARATAVRQPQLKMIVTEMVFKYLGDGVFGTTRTKNTQAVQSLIRLMRDPVVGNTQLSNDNMDKLIATQAEVEGYFRSAEAGQFCYTFDKYETTAQEIITTIAEAIFCSATRRGHSILLNLERPRLGPEMVFTHRSKAPTGEKWTRQFNNRSAYDSLKFSWINPNTNIKETINIPVTGGVKTDTFDSKGIRNYQQAYWHAWRRYQRNKLNRVAVEFTALEEGVLAVPARPISVVKGSRVSPYDGYVVAVNGLTLTLSQNVVFEDGEDHSVILKKRDGSVQSVQVVAGGDDRTVIMLSAPQEALYTGNSALKTEFSFGSDSRHAAQMIMVSTVEPSDDRTVKITGFNYDAGYYEKDGVPPFGRAFSDGFNNGFS